MVLCWLYRDHAASTTLLWKKEKRVLVLSVHGRSSWCVCAGNSTTDCLSGLQCESFCQDEFPSWCFVVEFSFSLMYPHLFLWTPPSTSLSHRLISLNTSLFCTLAKNVNFFFNPVQLYSYQFFLIKHHLSIIFYPLPFFFLWLSLF